MRTSVKLLLVKFPDTLTVTLTAAKPNSPENIYT